MSAPTSFQRIAPTIACVFVLVMAMSTARAQTDRFMGRWIAVERDHGITVSLMIGPSSTLTMPGLRQDGTSLALTLAVRNLMTRVDLATFTVDLPENEGTLELEFRVAAADDSGALRVVRVDGEAADDAVPTWVLRKAR
jgi:hypothetical protein